MKEMTRYFEQSGTAVSLKSLLLDEIKTNADAVSEYENDWTRADIAKVLPVLASEKDVVVESSSLSRQSDSVKGEDAMKAVYTMDSQRKATDVITRRSTNDLALTELKYLVKFASKGPFGGRSSFRSRISDKFYEMANVMELDGEVLDPLRIIVVTQDQFPFSVNYVRALVDGEYEPGSFSKDGRQHNYVLCTSSNLRLMIDNPPVNIRNVNEYLFFKL